VQLVRRDQLLTALFVLWGVTMLAQGIMSALWVPFVEGTLHGSAVLFGMIATAQGVGSIIGGLLVGLHLPRTQVRRRLTLSGLAVGLLFLAMISVRAPTLILVLSAGLGVPVLIFDVGVETALQRAVVDGYRGRVLGAFAAVGALVMLVGVLLGSIGATALAVLPLLDVAGGLLALSGLLAWGLLPHADEEDSGAC
jgi:MFS family permease